jgi:hypothetical protein
MSKTPTAAAAPDLEKTYNEIEASLPGLHDWVGGQLAARGQFPYAR